MASFNSLSRCSARAPRARLGSSKVLITGIGFIGGGAILKNGDHVRGTATAASLWNTGVIGAAVGYGQYDIGLVLAALNFLTLRYLVPFKREQEVESSQEAK